MWFDPKAALAKIEREADPPATSATSATSTVEKGPQVAEVAEVAAPQPGKREIAGVAPSCGLLSPSVPFVPSVNVSKGSSRQGLENAEPALATSTVLPLEKRILVVLPILLAGRRDSEITAAGQVVTAFLNGHLKEARRIGWADLELFGCYPVREAARNRYDYAGAVTLAAMSGHSIEQITVRAAHYENGLAYIADPCQRTRCLCGNWERPKARFNPARCPAWGLCRKLKVRQAAT